MLHTLLITVGMAAPAPVAVAPSVAPLVQDDPKDLPDKREEVKEMVSQLKEHASKRGKEDVQAIATIDSLVVEFTKSGLKDRTLIAKELGALLKQKRKEVDGVLDNKLYLASAVSLGRMGPESVKVISGWIDHKTHRKDLELQCTLIRSLGKTKDEKGVKTLLDLLSHHEARIQAASGEALGNYVHLDQKDRKDIFKEVLQTVTGVYNRMELDKQDIIARERYDVIAAPMITTLQVLSGHDERQPPEWRRWWNKNKKADWDKEG